MWDNNIKFNDTIDNKIPPKQAKISKKKKKKKQTLPNPSKTTILAPPKKKAKRIFFIRFHFGTLQLIEHHG